MDGAQLLDLFRKETGDDVGPEYLWSDATAFGFLTEAEQQACVRGDLIRFERAIPLVSADETATVLVGSPRVTKITKARLQWPGSTSTVYNPLTILGVEDQDDDRRDRTGRPTVVYLNDQTLILNRIPTYDGVLHIEGYREPTYDIETGSDEPEIPAFLHVGLLQWCYYRAYSTKDSQTYDQPRADRALAMFERQFGPLPTARHMRRRREGGGVTVARSRNPLL